MLDRGGLRLSERAHTWWPLALILGVWAILKAYGLHLTPGDEGIYFYMAGRMAEAGLVPYRDFFFAHPPVHVYTAALVFKAVGAGALSSKLIAPTAAGLTVALTYGATVRRLGRPGAVAAALLLVLSYDFLRSATHFTGINVTLALATAAAVLAMGRRPALAGVTGAVACMAGVYAAPTAIGCGIIALAAGRRDAIRWAAGFAGTLLAVHGLFLALAGDAFIDQVYRYHLAKPGKPGQARGMALRVLVDNLPLVASPLLALGGLGVAAARRRLPGPRALLTGGSPEAMATLALALGLGNLAVLSSLQKAFPFYFLMAFPGLAVCGGYAGRWIHDAYGRLLTPPAPAGRNRRQAALVLGLAVALVGSLYAQRPAVRRAKLPGSIASAPRTFTWVDAEHLPESLNFAVRRLLWEATRAPRTDNHAIQRYLWHESRRYPLLPELVRYVEERVPADGALFGDSLVGPYLAFLTGRRISAEEADSNAARFRSGTSSPADVIEAVEADPPAYVVVRPGRGFSNVPGFQPWLRGMRAERGWKDPKGGRLLLLVP